MRLSHLLPGTRQDAGVREASSLPCRLYVPFMEAAHTLWGNLERFSQQRLPVQGGGGQSHGSQRPRHCRFLPNLGASATVQNVFEILLEPSLLLMNLAWRRGSRFPSPNLAA